MAGDFWWYLTMACLVWYATITAYVSVRGAANIKEMLARLNELERPTDDGEV